MIHAGVALAATIKVEVGDFSCIQVDVFDIHTEALQLLHTSDLIICCEELYQPAIDEFAGHVLHYIGVDSFKIEVVPKLQMGISFEGLGELFQNRFQASDIFLEFTVHIEFLKIG